MTQLKFDVHLFSLENEEIESTMFSTVEFTDACIRRNVRYVSRQRNDGIWSEFENRASDWKIKRVNIAAIDLSYVAKVKCWVVGVDASGVAETMNIYFESRKEADPVWKTLNEWAGFV